jgi:SAM-dependent methyltransferase
MNYNGAKKNMMSWVEPFHDDYLVKTFLLRQDPKALKAEVDFLENVLSLSVPAKVLDQCCGIGSLSKPLVERGYEVHGVDMTPAYIQMAKKNNVGCFFTCTDACHFVEPDCDAVFNWWTGFGYLSTDEENQKMLSAAYNSLRSGGCYLLDVPNVCGVLRHFKPITLTKHETDQGCIDLKRVTTLDLKRGRMNKTWSYTQGEIILAEHQTSVRIFNSHELVAMFERVGFVDIKLYGDMEKTLLNIDHLRCICIGTKP